MKLGKKELSELIQRTGQKKLKTSLESSNWSIIPYPKAVLRIKKKAQCDLHGKLVSMWHLGFLFLL